MIAKYFDIRESAFELRLVYFGNRNSSFGLCTFRKDDDVRWQ